MANNIESVERRPKTLSSRATDFFRKRWNSTIYLFEGGALERDKAIDILGKPQLSRDEIIGLYTLIKHANEITFQQRLVEKLKTAGRAGIE
jgi:hypothetical protein